VVAISDLARSAAAPNSCGSEMEAAGIPPERLWCSVVTAEATTTGSGDLKRWLAELADEIGHVVTAAA
jgi:hypothetical protein